MAADRMRELVLYICARSETDPRFGATKLNKILFYSDFLAYYRLGDSVSGEVYQKLDHGPAPKYLLPLRNDMEAKRELIIREKEYCGRIKKQPFALRLPDLTAFTGSQVAIVDEVIKALWNKNADDVSNMSHQFLGWQLAELQEEIPYETALVSCPEEFSQSQLDWLESLRPLAKERAAA